MDFIILVMVSANLYVIYNLLIIFVGIGLAKIIIYSVLAILAIYIIFKIEYRELYRELRYFFRLFSSK